MISRCTDTVCKEKTKGERELRALLRCVQFDPSAQVGLEQPRTSILHFKGPNVRVTIPTVAQIIAIRHNRIDTSAICNVENMYLA